MIYAFLGDEIILYFMLIMVACYCFAEAFPFVEVAGVDNDDGIVGGISCEIEADYAVATELVVIEMFFVGCGGDGFTVKIIGFAGAD